MRLSSGQPKLCWTRPGRCFDGSTCHNSLIPMPYFCGSRARPKRAISPFASEPRAPSAIRVYLASSAIPLWNPDFTRTVLADPHVAGGDAGDRAARVVEGLDGGETGEDFDPERLRLLAQPAAQVPERYDEIAVVGEERRHQEVGETKRALGAEPEEMVRRHGLVHRRATLPPVRQ